MSKAKMDKLIKPDKRQFINAYLPVEIIDKIKLFQEKEYFINFSEALRTLFYQGLICFNKKPFSLLPFQDGIKKKSRTIFFPSGFNETIHKVKNKSLFCSRLIEKGLEMFSCYLVDEYLKKASENMIYFKNIKNKEVKSYSACHNCGNRIINEPISFCNVATNQRFLFCSKKCKLEKMRC